MTKIVGVFLVVGASFSLAYGQTKRLVTSSAVEAVKQLEHDWNDAQKSRDIEKLSHILADDWAGLGFDGTRTTKREFLDDIKTGTSKLESFDAGPMDVKVIGNVAIVQGTDTEKSTEKGTDSSGKWVWMDVFVNRNGKWQAVRSQSAMVK